MKNLDGQDQDKENLADWLRYKSSVPNILDVNKVKLTAVTKALREDIEKDVVADLRTQIQATWREVTDMLILSAKAEKQYRDAQKEAARNCPVILKSDARKAWMDGECSDFQYQRNILANFLQGLRDRLGIQKGILYSLSKELKESAPLDAND